MKPRRTAPETWEALEAQWMDDEMQRVLAMTPAARRAELRAAGVDVDGIGERLDAVRRSFQAGGDADGPRWRPAHHTHALGWIALTLLAALGAATTVGLLARHVVGPHGRVFETASPP